MLVALTALVNINRLKIEALAAGMYPHINWADEPSADYLQSNGIRDPADGSSAAGSCGLRLPCDARLRIPWDGQKRAVRERNRRARAGNARVRRDGDVISAKLANPFRKMDRAAKCSVNILSSDESFHKCEKII